jgi:DNA-directed RNA polymerase subunit beta
MSTTKTQQRVSFSTVKNRVPYPDLLEVQLKSFRDFFQMDTTAENRKNEGLYKVFQENFPITDTRNNFVLEFIDYYIDPPRYSIEECLERGLTYSVPLKAKLKLYCTDDEHEDFGVVVQDVYFGTIPYMTERGTFVINGAERVIVPPLAGRVLRTEHAHQRYEALFSSYHPVQGIVDRVRYRHQQRDVRVHRP